MNLPHPARRLGRTGTLAALVTVAGYLLAAPSDQAAGKPRPQQAGAPQDVPPELERALGLARSGDLAAAIDVAEALCSEEGAPVAAFGVLGGLHVEGGNFGRALEVLAPLAESEAADPAVLYNAGRASEGLQRFPEAESYYRRSLAIQPRSPALRSLGMMIGRLGRPGVAYEFLRPWIAANPSDDEARIAAAAGAIALERTPEANGLLEGLPANDPGVKLLRAQILLQRSDPWGAINELRPLEAERPTALDVAIRRILARAYLVVGEAEGALEQMEPLKGRSPEDAVTLASAYFQASRLEEAIETLAPYAESLIDNPPEGEVPPLVGHLALDYGRYLHSAGDAARAIPFLRLATELDPTTPAAFQALGQALAATGERDLARQMLERFQELSKRAENELLVVDRQQRETEDPTSREVRQALELANAGSVEEALERLRREARLAPGDPRPAYAASSILVHAGRPEEALAVADEALVVAPGGADGFYQRAVVLMALKRLDEAEDMFRQALAAAPEHTAALSDYAVLLMSQGRNTEAARHLNKVLQFRPNDTLARQHLERLGPTERPEPGTTENWSQIGRDLVREENFAGAIEPLRRAVEQEPQDSDLHLDLALALWENSQPAEAEEHAREAVTVAPSSEAAHRILGGLLLWRADYLAATESLERAAALVEPDAALLIELGRAWLGAADEAAGSPDEEVRLARAEAAYRRAVELAPEHSEAMYGLAQTLRRLGRDEEASAQMKRYLELYAEDQRNTRESGRATARRRSPNIR